MDKTVKCIMSVFVSVFVLLIMVIVVLPVFTYGIPTVSQSRFGPHIKWLAILVQDNTPSTILVLLAISGVISMVVAVLDIWRSGKW